MIGWTRAIAAIALFAPATAGAHQLNVFASVDCESVTVEAKFSNGKYASEGEVRVMDANSMLLTTLALEADGTQQVPLDSVDHSSGLVIEVDVGSHDDYWIVTPDDIARNCAS
ncbi:MAG: hypothetical protein AAFN59_00910 [Pseudomonadota bacterium]